MCWWPHFHDAYSQKFCWRLLVKEVDKKRLLQMHKVILLKDPRNSQENAMGGTPSQLMHKMNVLKRI